MKKKIFVNLCLIYCAILGLSIIATHMIFFLYANYINEHPDVTTQIGVNVVSPWADFSFFTYITVIIFSLWCIGYALSNIFSWQRLNNFLRKDTLLSFVFCNYLLTISLYTFYQLFEELPFGWFGNHPISWLSLFASIILHYILFAVECVIFVKVRPIHSNHKKGHIYSATFLLTYYLIVKIVGEFAFPIRYFPYIIFDAQSIGNFVGISSYGWSVVLLVLCCGVLLAGYQFVFHLLLKLKASQQENFSTL